MSIKISGTGSCLPPLSVTNEDLSKILDTSHEWISSRTGIESRHICENGLTPVAAEAGAEALKDAGYTVDEMDYILCATVSPDYATPSLACMVQQELGGTCPALDIGAACSGFLYGLDMAQALIESGKAKRILLIAGESMSSTVDWTKRDVSVLFGDGAGAVVLEEGEELLSIRIGASGRAEPLFMKRPGGNCPYVPKQDGDVYLHMDGQEIYKFAVNAMVRDILSVMEAAGISAEEVDYVLPHQANLRILDAASKKLPIPPEKFLHNISGTGNTSAASVPILLDEARKAGKIKAGQLLVMSAFGAGLTTGACVIKWSKD
ncbi:MAG: beta-ketoacyl-ACP synthase III [Bacillota bacterium]|nr:ketoacyl-ACP synthase III [Eubacteriales bacterium]MDD4285806.1 ketoacyl-ACP synthase III [Eubacteriales bacterium]MDI9491389.1 beta-ketoacyl-ACP synthase III [Bacillota bacterium]NLV69894.1 ketoacyl-ACP synthase III [Clostridiales bacterium]HPF18804.1 beta-ketoacyl-ACP synthase III [Bacillota bacterium]